MVIKRKEGDGVTKKGQGKGKAQASASRAKSRKGKEVVEDHYEEGNSGSESDNDRAPSKPGKGKKKDKSVEEPINENFTQKRARINQMEKEQKLTWVAIHYPDMEFHSEVGLREDVEAIFKNIRLSKFMSLIFDTYVDLTKEFLNIFRARRNKPRDYEWDDVGYIEFMINRRKYKVMHEELSEIYDLPKELHLTISKLVLQSTNVYNAIGTGAYGVPLFTLRLS